MREKKKKIEKETHKNKKMKNYTIMQTKSTRYPSPKLKLYIVPNVKIKERGREPHQNFRY